MKKKDIKSVEDKEVLLNSRQWALYNLLKSYNGEPVTQRKLCDVLSGAYGEYYYDDSKTFHDSQARQTMTNDIRVLNESDVIQKVIFSCAKGIYIASKDGYVDFLKKEAISLTKKIKRYKQKVEKFKKDNQMTLFEGTDRDYIEAFLK